ncbi:diguanylate cyclase, partial [bacterium]
MAVYVIPLFISALIMGGLAWYSTSLQGVPGVRAFRISLLVTSAWSLCYAVELLVPALGAKLTAANLAYIAIALLPITWLSTVMNYTGRGRQFARLCPWLLIVPSLTIGMVWTNPVHHWFIRQAALDANGAFVILQVQYGFWFWVHAIYTYLLLAVATAFLVGLMVRTPRRYVGQPVTLLLGMLIPVVWNVVYVTGLVPFRRLDLTPYLYSLSGLIFLVGLIYSRLFDILPVARDVVMDAMGDAVIVADYQDRVVDLNKTARQVFGWQADDELISRSIEDVFANWPTVIGLLRAEKPLPVEMVVKRGARQNYYQVSVSPLSDAHGFSLGRMLLLHNITDRKQMEEELRRLSVTDPLTDLGNRRKFFNALEGEFARAKRYHNTYSLIMLDLDHYKSINDRFSHMAGDEALK